jgi:integrase
MSHFPKPFFKKARGCWYVEINRRQINLGPERDAAFQQYHQLMQQPTERVVSADLLAVVIDSFLEWLHKNRAPDTYEWYRYRLQRLVLKYPDMRISSLRPFHIEQWVGDFKIGQTSRRNYFRSIKTCLRWAVNQGYIEKNPISRLEIPSAERRDVWLNQDQFGELLKYVHDDSARELLEVAYLTGCRPQELLRVTAQHFERDHARWVFPQDQAKGKKAPRIVYLVERAFDVTVRRVAANPTGPIFRNAQGRPWTPDAINCLFDRVQSRMGMVLLRERSLEPTVQQIQKFSESLNRTCMRKGVEFQKTPAELRHEAKKKLTGRIARSLVPRYSLYSLRHSWATNSLRRGVDPLTVAILMGHKDPSMLARVYQHLAHSPEHMLEQARKAVS